ncbi:DNA repair protein rad52 [Phytophthora pseudosyringae]|uniref:DNA repair protein rad52 n=1 Tax=Phytophthora pseudosyringae TaxID=221518 RepID=A0A8T1WFQ0_9STRA|nr:DNA repair protein rad52 [Phytophthora pseudosyringae]
MKRRLSETKGENPLDAADDQQQTVATLVAQQVAAALMLPLAGGGAARFGRVAFAEPEQQSVNTFLHQKLGKDSLTRRPGPGGRKLTYIESCKAIELANRAFGFNGWSCRIVECKEEYKEKKGDRWSIAFSALVRIELKDGTSHEDVGFGTSDGQKDLGAALEQAKKASVSDARKRALRLFGEYLGNSCYDKDHIKDVHSNRPMAPLAAAPNVIFPGQQVQNGALAAVLETQGMD